MRVSVDRTQYRKDLEAFRELLQSKEELEENTDIKPFFEAHPQLSAAIGGCYGWLVAEYDLVAFQYQLFGDFGCDLVVGDSASHLFGFIEFEDATAGSLFRQQGRKATPEWATRCNAGFMQIVDWLWKLDDMSRTDDFAIRFGSRHAEYFGLLIIGRDEHIQHARESSRWHWRNQKIVVNNQPVRLVTYDQLYRTLVKVVGRSEADNR